MRKTILLLFGLVIGAVSCQKENSPKLPIDPVVNPLEGKWVLHSMEQPAASVVINLNGGLKADPFSDTIVYTYDNQYLIIEDNGDTTDRGSYNIGRDSALNGFGHMQVYDSLRYSSAKMTHDAPFNPVIYFRLNLKLDTLAISQEYFKDSAAIRKIGYYLRQQ